MEPSDHAFVASFASTALTILRSAMLCSGGIAMLLSEAHDRIDWDRIADLARRADGSAEDLCSGELAVLGEYIDDPRAAFTDRWSIRFGSILSALRFEVRPFLSGNEVQRETHVRLAAIDPLWAADCAAKISRLMKQCEPFAHTLEAISEGGPVRQDFAADQNRPKSVSEVTGETTEPTPDQPKRIPKAANLAGLSLAWVERERPDLTDMYSTLAELREAQHEFIQESGMCPAYQSERVPATADTWAKHVRVFQRLTDGPRRGVKRSPTRSIAPASQLPRARLDD